MSNYHYEVATCYKLDAGKASNVLNKIQEICPNDAAKRRGFNGHLWVEVDGANDDYDPKLIIKYALGTKGSKTFKRLYKQGKIGAVVYQYFDPSIEPLIVNYMYKRASGEVKSFINKKVEGGEPRAQVQHKLLHEFQDTAGMCVQRSVMTYNYHKTCGVYKDIKIRAGAYGFRIKNTKKIYWLYGCNVPGMEGMKIWDDC